MKLNRKLYRIFWTWQLSVLLRFLRLLSKLAKPPKFKSRVVFIPKQWKTDYTYAPAWCLVTLSSLVIKSVEKLVLWQLDGLSLINDSLSKDQHAFRAKYSTESALSDFVDDIESSITRDQIALGIFLDIKGAFNNCQHTTIVEQMRLKNFPKKGNPQGVILSPLAWNLILCQIVLW